MNKKAINPDGSELRFSVGQFNEFMNKNFELIGNVVVEGEITQYNITAKGGVNIVIKDDKESAILNISGYAPWIEGVKFVREGMKVAAYGKPSIWSQAGRFSLQIYKIIPLGEGALKEAYEKLKLQLEHEGLFDESRKRPLPEYISSIALLTGKDSAAQSDFLKILKENNAGINIDYFPVQVQGKYSESEIIKTLKSLNYDNYDCVVLVRGGGSLEDLITFNSENLARTIFSLPIPIIVGVGHEKDESIADFVADIRASTPSQAAYYIITNNENFINGIDLIIEQIGSFLLQRINNQISLSEQSLVLINQKLMQKIKEYKSFMDLASLKLGRLPNEIKFALEKISSTERLLNSFNPKNILKRGYSIVKDSKGSSIKSINSVNIDDTLAITVNDGEIKTKVVFKQPNK